MALLNPSSILPHVVRTIVETTRLGQISYTREDLVSALAARGTGKDKVVRDSLGGALMLRLVEEDDERVVPSARVVEFASEDGRRIETRRWQQILLQAVMEHEATDGAFAAEDDEGRTTGPRDLIRGATWFLALDAAGPLLTWDSDGRTDAQALQGQHFGTDRFSRWPVVNDTRINPLFRWCNALGLADGHVRPRPIPVAAVRDAVRRLEPGGYTIEELLAGLAGSLPFIWRGSYRNRLVEEIGEDPDPDAAAGGIDSSVGLALLSLEHAGILELKRLSDVGRRTMGTSSDRPVEVSHVEVKA